MHGAVQLWPAMELASTEFYERNLHASFCYGTNTGRLRGQRSLHIGVLDGGRLVESRRTRRGRSAERRQLPAIHGLRREQNREEEAKRGGKSISSFVTSTWGSATMSCERWRRGGQQRSMQRWRTWSARSARSQNERQS